MAEIFGIHSLPFRLCQLATWVAALTLVLLIGEKLTGSRGAAVVAAVLWAVNANAVQAVAWASAYDQSLCAVCLLAAFYSRLREWRAAEWIFFLAGFGALEITAMYPVLVLAYTLAADRKRLAGVWPLFAPSAIFTAAHFLLIPKSTVGPYVLRLDSHLPATVAAYLAWMFEPGSAALRSHAERLRAPELLLGMVLGLTLAGFALRCVLAQRWIALFFCAWFVVLLAPMLLLPGHLTPYYLTLPSVGLAWLAGLGGWWRRRAQVGRPGWLRWCWRRLISWARPRRDRCSDAVVPGAVDADAGGVRVGGCHDGGASW